MRKFYTWVVHHTTLILTVFLLAAVAGFFLKDLVAVNYEMADYLPEESPSTISLDLMKEEFDGGIPGARVMVRDVTIPQALEYKEKLEAVPGVEEVTWLDDSVDVKIPLVMLAQETVETYSKDNTALFTLTIEEGREVEAVDAVRIIIGDENAMSGNSVSTAIATTSTVNEIAKIASFAVAFVLVVLLLTTESWLEPFLILIGLGVAIIINNGSNLIFGEISFVTNAAGSVLQLAVSLDYSVFLLHRFEECQKDIPDVREAMLEALCRSTSSIVSSGLTTVIGFLALVFMRFRIGPDLGLALAKGVAISLITVFLFMPSLLLKAEKLRRRLRHRSFVPDFTRFGKVVRHAMLPLVIVFLLVMVPSYLASNSNSFYYGSSYIFGLETQLGADTEEIEEVFGKQETFVLMVPKGSLPTQKALSEELNTLPQITDIISYVDTVGMEVPKEYLDEEILSMLESEHYSRMVITAETEPEGDDTFALIEQIRVIADSYYPGETYLAGNSVSSYDLMDTVTADMMKVNLIAIGAVFAVLLLTMKSVLLPVLLVLSIETAIWMNLSFPYFWGATIFYIAYLIISSVQLGATVDYAILMTDRYRENRETLSKKKAVVQTIASVTVSIMTSGSVLAVVGFLLGHFSSHGILSQLGTFLGRGSLISMFIVLFVLPGLLYLCDRWIHKGKKADEKQEEEVMVK